jgi:hypothetical protein
LKCTSSVVVIVVAAGAVIAERKNREEEYRVVDEAIGGILLLHSGLADDRAKARHVATSEDSATSVSNNKPLRVRWEVPLCRLLLLLDDEEVEERAPILLRDRDTVEKAFIPS